MPVMRRPSSQYHVVPEHRAYQAALVGRGEVDGLCLRSPPLSQHWLRSKNSSGIGAVIFPYDSSPLVCSQIFDVKRKPQTGLAILVDDKHIVSTGPPNPEPLIFEHLPG